MGVWLLIRDFVKVFKAIAEPTRMRILRILATKDMYVCELEFVLSMSQPRVSSHLRALREAELISEEKEGRKTKISLHVERLDAILTDFTGFMQTDIEELPALEVEKRRIEELKRVPIDDSCCVDTYEDEKR